MSSGWTSRSHRRTQGSASCWRNSRACRSLHGCSCDDRCSRHTNRRRCRRFRCCRRGRFGLGRSRFLGLFRRSFLGSEIVEVFPSQFGVLDVQRARVRLLFLNADLGKVVDQHLGLDLEFPCQLVDTNLIDLGHELLFLLPCFFRRILGFRGFRRFRRLGSSGRLLNLRGFRGLGYRQGFRLAFDGGLCGRLAHDRRRF